LSLRIQLPESRRKSITDHQLLSLLETAPKVAYAFIQSRTENIPNIAKHTLMLFHAQPFAQKTDYGRKILVGAEFEDALGEMRGRAYGLQADGYCRRNIQSNVWLMGGVNSCGTMDLGSK
jgi:hypothetical protein